jgi:hypothetical protein
VSTRNLARPARRWAEPAARVGHAAKGVVYVMVGALAVRAAVGWGGRATDTRGALRALGQADMLGGLVLAVVAVGLAAYVFWRLAQGALDLDGKGGDARGLVVRAGYVGSGLAYGGLALTAAGLALGAGAGGGGDNVRTWTAHALADPDRWWLVAAAGVAVLGGAAYQLYKAWSAKFLDRLRLSSLPSEHRLWVRRLGRIGLVARGVTFAVIGWFLVRAGLHVNAGEARGLGGALRYLRAQDYGPWLLGGIGVGFVAYGIFSMVEGRYRRIG